MQTFMFIFITEQNVEFININASDMLLPLIRRFNRKNTKLLNSRSEILFSNLSNHE